MNQNARLFILAIGLLAAQLLGCGRTTPEDRALLPDLDIECSITQVANCTSTNAGHSVYVGLKTDLTTSCVDHLAMVPPNLLTQSFDYFSVAQLADQGTYLLAIAKNWQGYDYSPQSFFETKTYQVCAFIDFNENGQLDTFEPFHEGQITGGAPFNPISTWEIL